MDYFYFIIFLISLVFVWKWNMIIQMFFVHLGLFIIQFFMMPFIYIINMFKKRKMCPVVKNPLLLKSAKKLAFMIRTRQVKCEDVIRAYIARIDEVNPIINAVVENRFDKAIKEAKEIDAFIESTQKSETQIENDTPLLGVPITVKESLSLAGMSNAAGLIHKEKVIATRDAEIVRLCKEAGAIPLLVSNTPELCMFWETFNNITGRTKNAYDTRRTAGGSSGGEAALLGSGASVIGLGSDICGSLRLPTMFNGVYGHKPTADIISVDGHVPGSTDKNWTKYFVTGPMTRYAEDMPLMLSIIAKPELRDVLRLNQPVSMREIKFFYMENNTNYETLHSMREFARYLQNEYGITAQKIHLKLLKNAFPVCIPQFLSIEEVESPFYDSNTKKFSIGKHLIEFVTCRSKLTFPLLLFGILNKCSGLFKGSKLRLSFKLSERLQNQFKEILGDNGVLLYPTFTDVAHFHNEAFYKIVDTCYLSIFNTIGLPATTCPTGYNSDGLPYGIQVVANPRNDRLTAAVAQELEKVFGGWKCPQQKTEKYNIV